MAKRPAIVGRSEALADALNDPDKMLDLIKEVGMDSVIMMLGAYLGYNGWTPLTALVNELRKAADGNFSYLSLVSPIVAYYTAGKAIENMINPETNEPMTANESAHARRMTAAIGALEAYALTRPGALQGIGEIIPL